MKTLPALRAHGIYDLEEYSRRANSVRAADPRMETEPHTTAHASTTGAASGPPLRNLALRQAPARILVISQLPW